LESMTQDLAPRESLIQLANEFWQKQLDRQDKPAAPEEEKPHPFSKWV
jgi:hypothetical protein